VNKKKLILTVAFVEGAVLMAIELAGAKLISPYYGGSVYVWATVLGFTLSGLAVGYFTGGFISKNKVGSKVLQIVLLLLSFTTMFMPYVAQTIMDLTLGIENFRVGIVVSVILFLFPALILCGIVSPMLIALLDEIVKSAGKASGLIYSTSTLGGILATFLIGFVMIPYLGVMLTCLIFGLLLFVTTIFFIFKQ